MLLLLCCLWSLPSTVRSYGGNGDAQASKSQNRRSRLRRTAVLKALQHSDKLRGCLAGIPIQTANPGVTLSAETKAIARLEEKLDTFVQMVMYKLDFLYSTRW